MVAPRQGLVDFANGKAYRSGQFLPKKFWRVEYAQKASVSNTNFIPGLNLAQNSMIRPWAANADKLHPFTRKLPLLFIPAVVSQKIHNHINKKKK